MNTELAATANSVTSVRVSIPPKDRVPKSQKAFFGIGIVSEQFANQGINSFALPIYNVILGLSPTTVGLVFAIARLWDAFTDPFVGSLSDNSKSPYGRRKPFLFLGAILTGIAFPFIWFGPETVGDFDILLHLCFSLFLFYSAYSLFSVPYQSLGMELTASYSERTNVYVWSSYIQVVSRLLIPWMLAAATLPVFDSVLIGTRWVSVLAGLMFIAAGLLPALFCQERYLQVASKQAKEPFFSALGSLKKNNPFLLVVSSIAIFIFANWTSHTLDIYVNTYYIYDGTLRDGALLTGYGGTLNAAFSIVGIFLVQIFSKRTDKRNLILICVATLVLCRVAIPFLYNPNSPWGVLILKPFSAMAGCGFWILILSMRADVADWDEFLTGKRREGIIAAANNWIVKVSMTSALLFGSVILQHAIGFDRVLGGKQSEETLDKLLLSYAIIPGIGLIIVFIILLRYPLTRKKTLEVRRTLECRREAV